MSTVAQQLTELVREAARTTGHGEELLEPCVVTNDPRHGDYQSNYAFRVGRALRTNPRAVAQALVEALPPTDMVDSVQVAGPGFVNFRLSDAWLGEDLTRRGADDRLLTPRSGEGRTLVIDYSSPNIAKRMHVGHLRSTIIGNALDRIHRFLGWRVVADNHVGDWGTQFGKLIVGWHGWRDDEAFAADPIEELQRLYQEFGRRAEEQPELLDQARAETARLQEGEPSNRALWKQFVDVSLREFDAVYQRLGVHFDATLGESFYRDRLPGLVQGLLDDGLAVVDQGAVIVPFDEGDGKGLAKSPLLVRKSDGASLYGTTDLATVAHRLEQWEPDVIAYVTDVRQRLHFRQMFAACRKMGVEAELVHVWFGMLRLKGGEVASTRSGQVLNLVDVLDTAVAHARAVVDAKSGHLPDEERAAIAEAVGIGAIRYADLSQNPQSDIVFDWDRMLSLEGNTAPYLMYAYARCQSIARKAGDLEPGDVRLVHPSERQLALAIARTPEAVERAAASWRPNMLCDHLFGLANTFATFYHDCRVLGDEVPADVGRSRLSLVHATARALSIGLELLGLQALERM